MANTKITAVESYVPPNMVGNDFLSSIVDTSDEWISSRTGILKRNISNGEDTSVFATKVSAKLMEKSGIGAKDIDLIIVATITPDYLTPSTSCIVQGNIGATNALAFDINAACSGFVYALSIAHKMIKSGIYKNAIVIGAEVLSKMVDWKDRGTCVLFGDGAGGVILENSECENDAILSEDLKSDGTSWGAITGGKTGINNPFVNDLAGNEKFLQMNGRDVFNFATKTVPKSVLDVIKKANVSLDEVKYIVPHQANYRIIEVVAKKLDVNIDKFYLNLKDYGNTSSASIPIALSEMDKKGLIKKGDKLILTGFGAGLTWGSVLITI